MNNTTMKKLTAMAVSAVMAASMVGVVGASATYSTASASTITAVAEDGTIGIGESNQAADITITDATPATLTLSGVSTGRYVVYLYVTQSSGDGQYIISAQFGNGTPVDFVMDQNIYKLTQDYQFYYMYVAAIDVTNASDNLTLSVRHRYEQSVEPISLTVNTYLTPFTIDDSTHLGGIPVSEAAPATLALSHVTAGKYVLTASALSITTTQYSQFPLSVEFGGNKISVPYAQVAGAFTAILDVTDETQLTLSTDSTDSCVLDVRLVPYSISSDALRLAGVRVSSTAPAVIPLEEMNQSSYIVTVELDDSYELTPVTLYAQFDSGETKQLTRDNNYIVGYSADFQTLTGAHELTITTDSDVELIVAVSIEESTIEGPLPTDRSILFDLYQTHSYSYTSTFSGYHTISVTSNDVPNAMFDVTLTTSPNSFDYVEIHGNNFPVYLENGQICYFHITYTGRDITDPEEPPVNPEEDTAHATFAVSEWVNEAISVDTYYYVPVTPESEGIEHVGLNFAEGLSGEYTFSLFAVPMLMELEGGTVTLHYDGNTYDLENDPINPYVVNITMSDTTEFYLTTSYGERVTLGLLLTKATEEPDTLDLFTTNSVTLTPSEEGTPYLVENVGAGAYTVTISNITNPEIEILSSTSESAIISAGEISGEFTVILTGDTSVTTVELILKNNSAEEAQFDITIVPVNRATVGTEQQLTLRVNHAYSNYMELAAGAYQVALGNVPEGKEVRVYANGVQVELDADNTGVIPVGQSGQVCVSYIYYDEAEGLDSLVTIDITATVTGVNTLLPGDTIVSLSTEENSKTYYFVGEAGTYTIYILTDPTNVSIKNGEQTIINYGIGYGTLTIAPVEGQTYFAIPLDILYNGDSQVNVEIYIEKNA